MGFRLSSKYSVLFVLFILLVSIISVYALDNSFLQEILGTRLLQ